LDGKCSSQFHPLLFIILLLICLVVLIFRLAMVRSIQMIKINFITVIMGHLSGMVLLIIGKINSIHAIENTRRVVIVGLMVYNITIFFYDRVLVNLNSFFDKFLQT